MGLEHQDALVPLADLFNFKSAFRGEKMSDVLLRRACPWLVLNERDRQAPGQSRSLTARQTLTHSHTHTLTHAHTHILTHSHTHTLTYSHTQVFRGPGTRGCARASRRSLQPQVRLPASRHASISPGTTLGFKIYGVPETFGLLCANPLQP